MRRNSHPSCPPPEEEGGKVTINDAYDWNEEGTGSNRPNLGDDYTEVLPPTSVGLTIAESSDIRFKGGQSEFKLEIGKPLKESDFDESTTGGHKVGGVVTLNEDGTVKSYTLLKDFIPLEDAEIIPYLAPDKGDLALFGNSRIGDWYFDEEGNDISKNPDYQLTGETLLINNFIGRKVTAAGALKKGTNFRSVTTLARVSGQTYVYNYDIKNFGDEEVSLTVYQMSTGGDITNTNTFVKGNPVTIAAGETQTVSIKERNLKDDGNSLTTILLDGDVQALSLGIMMSRENVTPTKPVTITLNLPAGFSVADSYNREVRTGDKLVLPTAAQITNNTGHNFIRWVYSNSNHTPVEAGVTINANMSIEPLLTEDVKIEFVNLPEGFSVLSDYNPIKQTGDSLVLPTAAQIKNTTRHHLLYWEYEEGGRVNDGLILTENMKLQPVFTKDVNITLDLPANLSVSSDYSKVMQEGDKLVLPTDAQITNNTGHKLIRWMDANGNQVTNDTVLKKDITIKPELSQTATITVKLPNGYTLAADYKKTAETGDKLVVPTDTQITGTAHNGRKLVGWYVVGNGNKLVDADTVIWEPQITIAPVFSRISQTRNLEQMKDASQTGKSLVFGNEQGDCRPQRLVNGDVTKTDAFYGATSRWENTVAVGGGDGYAEMGIEFGYKGTLVKNAEFRYATVMSDNVAVVKKSTNHTFYYNFENLGDTAIDFDVQGVNDGGNVEGPRTNVKLAPGESTRIYYTVKYTKGNDNKNVMVYFFFNEEVVNLRLGVSISLVSLADGVENTVEDESASAAPANVMCDVMDNRRED